MIAAAITVVLIALASLVAIGFVLSPILAWSGISARMDVKSHQAAATSIERLLSQR